MVTAIEFVIISRIASVSAGGNAWEKPVPTKENRLAMHRRNPNRTFIILPGFIIQII
jgi:hypothetical protein